MGSVGGVGAVGEVGMECWGVLGEGGLSRGEGDVGGWSRGHVVEVWGGWRGGWCEGRCVG